MFRTSVLAFLYLFVGLTHCFRWDIVEGTEKRLDFYYNLTLTRTEHIPSATHIVSVTYDPVQNRVIFADINDSKLSISSFELSTREVKYLFTRKFPLKKLPNYYPTDVSFEYDPVTQFIFWIKKIRGNYYSIRSFSLKPGNKATDRHDIISEKTIIFGKAVDSCGGYIYWSTGCQIFRARFDGSKRKVVITDFNSFIPSLAIDQQTQTMYWIEEMLGGDNTTIKSANLNGENKRTFYTLILDTTLHTLTITKDFIYCKIRGGVWQLPKNQQHNVKPKLFSISYSNCSFCQGTIVANYAIKGATEGNRVCEALNSLMPDNTDLEHTGESLICVHGTKVSGESRCECTQGYIGETCDISICQNYCVQGDCSVSAEGQPKCRCNAGYFGERCEVNPCHEYCRHNGVCSLNEENKPVCQCTADYAGNMCHVLVRKDYCFHGDYSVSAEGQHKCRCNAGYSGERCEFDACHEHCLNNGTCFLNADNKPVCRCTAGYEGDICDAQRPYSAGADTTQQILRDLRRTRQVIKEELERTLQFYSDKIEEYEAKL